MGNYSKPSYGNNRDQRIFSGNKRSAGGRGGDSRQGGFRDRDGGERPMFSATCDGCKNQCEVPFKPNGTKPVFCNDCFKSEGSSNDRDRGSNNKSFGGRDRDSRDSGRKPDFNKGGDRPVTSGWQSSTAVPNYSEVKKELDALNKKIDSLITLLSPTQAKSVTANKSLKELIDGATDTVVEKPTKTKTSKKESIKDSKATIAKITSPKAVKVAEKKEPKAKVAKKEPKAKTAKKTIKK